MKEDAAVLPNKQHLESEQEETLMMGVSGRGLDSIVLHVALSEC